MRSQKGFSLIELLIVIAMIGIISAIAIPSFIQEHEAQRARDDFPKYFGVTMPTFYPDEAQRVVLKPAVEHRLKELSDNAQLARKSLNDLLALPPVFESTEVQTRLNAVSEAEIRAKAADEHCRRAQAAAKVYGLVEK